MPLAGEAPTTDGDVVLDELQALVNACSAMLESLQALHQVLSAGGPAEGQV